MVYYHVGIKEAGGDLHTKYDFTDPQTIITKYIVPYKKSQNFVISGSLIKPHFIKTFYIIPTKEPIDSFIKKMNDNQPFPQYNKKDIFHYFQDYNVFDDFLDYDVNEIKTKEQPKVKRFKRPDSIFIVHGHDEGMMKAAEDFVRKIGYKPIILKDEVSQGKTIIEKIEEYSDVPYAIVLYSPCDKGYDAEKPNEAKFRARQNVVFEHGYLISKLSRKNVCALVKDGVEIPSDLSGLVYTPYKEGWEEAIVKELKSLGFKINNGWSSL